MQQFRSGRSPHPPACLRIVRPGAEIARERNSVLHSSFRTSRFSRIGGLRLAPVPAVALLLAAVGLTTLLTRQVQDNEERHSKATPVEAKLETPNPSPSVAPTTPEVAHSKNKRAGISSEPHRVASIRQPSPAQKETASVLVRQAEEKYLAAIAILRRDAIHHRAQLDTDTRQQLEQTLASVDRAIASTRKAVKAAPGDPVALQYMLAAYSRKVDLLRQMVGD